MIPDKTEPTKKNEHMETTGKTDSQQPPVKSTDPKIHASEPSVKPKEFSQGEKKSPPEVIKDHKN